MVRPEAVDDVVRYVREDVLPMVTELEGCVGLSLLTDRGTGRCIVTSAWQTEAAMRSSAERVGASRGRAAERFATTPDGVTCIQTTAFRLP